ALVVAMAAVAATYAFAGGRLRSGAGLSEAIVATACVLSALAILRRGTRAWKSASYLALGILAIGAVYVVFMVNELRATPRYRPSAFDLVFLAIAALFLAPVRIEFAEHFEKEERREIAADVALIGAALGTILYLSVRPAAASLTVELSSAVFALIAAAAFASYGALALWVPSLAHVGQFAVIGSFCAGTMVFAEHWVNAAFLPALAAVDLPFGLGALGLALLVQVVPRGESDGSAPRRSTRYGRPLLTTVAVAAATGALGPLATKETHGELSTVQATCLILLMGAAIIVRILVNQIRSSQATRAVREALEEKEVALRETDRALARLKRANETLRESEERLRLVFEAAVDGIVELDPKDVIVRANEAFCHMVEVPHGAVEGQTWTALAAAINADESF